MASKEIGAGLKKARQRAGLTYQEVADKLKTCTKSALSSWKIGRAEPDGATLIRLGKIYGIEDLYALLSNESSASELSPHERQVIAAYRSHDFMRAAVDKLLYLT